jgi:hypothetical protein
MRHGATDDAEMNDGLDSDMGGGTWRVPNHSRRGRGMDPANKRLGLIALGVGGAVTLGVVLYNASGHRNAVVPVIQADSRPIRVKPENPGGLQVSGSNDEFMSGDATSTNSKMAPPAETPEPNVLRARQEDPPAVQKASLAAPDISSATPDAHPPVSALPDKRTAVAAPAPPAAAPSTAPASPPVAAAKGTLVQFAALGSEEAARAEWTQLNKKIPDLLGGRQANFSKTERDGKVYWRVRTGGFADMAQATSFCERARAKGAACSIASF